MSGENQPVLSCQQFEALLAEALDRTLDQADQLCFDSHRRQCAACRTLYAETHAGMQWLHSLPEVEPPAALLDKIMMATAGAVPAQPAPRTHAREDWWRRVRQWRPRLGVPALQPRFVMAFGMAFFSLSVLLNVVGFRLRDLRYVDLRPSAIVRGYYETSGRIARYYENIRLVYEVESRVQQLKRMTAPEPAAPPSGDKQKNPANQSGKPDLQFQNYSREEGQPAVAAVPRALSASTARRQL